MQRKTTIYSVIHQIGCGAVDCLTLSRMNDLLGQPINDVDVADLLNDGNAYELLCRLVWECNNEAHFSQTFDAACDIDC
jgi:hypothetical protein